MMTLKKFKEKLNQINEMGDFFPGGLLFKLDNGKIVPPYFHITEAGIKIKQFMDCGGVVRIERQVTFQLWTDEDFNHRLTTGKLLDIINNNEVISRYDDLEVQMEYQTETLGTYNLSNHDGKYFILNSVNTNCLAPDKCGIPTQKQTPQPKQCNTPSCC